MPIEIVPIEESEIKHLEESLFYENSKKEDYPAYDENLEEYASLFANYGIDIYEEIAEYIGTDVVIIDIGCGQGKALKNLRSLVGNSAEYWGITATPHMYVLDGIHIVVENASEIYNFLRKIKEQNPQKQIFVFSVYLARYLVDPMKYLEDIYNALGVGDCALMYEVPLPIVNKEREEIDEHAIKVLCRSLSRLGIQIKRRLGIFDNAMCIRKIHDSALKMPLKIVGIIPETKRLLYTLQSKRKK